MLFVNFKFRVCGSGLLFNLLWQRHCLLRLRSCSVYILKINMEGMILAVSWDTITLAKNEGGLGVRDLIYWNKACLIKLIWFLFFKAGSIWVAWFTERILSGNINNFWTLREKQSHSYTVKKLLRCRDLVFNWIKVKVGNGRSTLFWIEYWSPFGRIKDFLRLPPSSFLGTRQNATISDINRNGSWRLPSARSEEQLALQTYLTTISLSEDEDTYLWSPEDKELPSYSTGMIYKLIKLHNPQVSWFAAVWTRKGIPKHNFLAWMMVLNRCPTRDRILNWGLQTNPNCLLCNNAAETRDHLYFNCPFSFQVWEALAIKSGCQPVRQWSQCLAMMQALSLPKHQKLLSLLSWQSTIYLLWTERNHMLHRQQFHQSNSIITIAISLIKNRVSSLRNSSPRLSSLMMQYWLRD